MLLNCLHQDIKPETSTNLNRDVKNTEKYFGEIQANIELFIDVKIFKNRVFEANFNKKIWQIQ